MISCFGVGFLSLLKLLELGFHFLELGPFNALTVCYRFFGGENIIIIIIMFKGTELKLDI